ncbi:MAG TPA: RCC1 domain-containing protein [Solirubrobacteraceae bacterium]
MRAAVTAMVACAALTACAGAAQAGVTSPQPVSPTGFHVQEGAVATGGGRIAVVMLGYRSSRDFSLQARTGGVRGLGPLQRLDGSVEFPQVAVGADGTAVAAWTAQRRNSTPVLRVAVARPGHSFGQVQTLSTLSPMGALGGVGVTSTGRAVVAWRRGASTTPVQVAIAAPGRPFGTPQTLGENRQSGPSGTVPVVTVAPSGTVVVAWLDTPTPPQPPPAPPLTVRTARVLAATLAAGAARFDPSTELAALSASGPEAASGPGGAAVTWRQAATEVRLAPLTTGNVFAPAVLLPPYRHRWDGGADLGDHVALGLPAGGSNDALWRESRTRNFKLTFAAVKSSSRPSGGVFSPAKQLSTSGWLAGTPRAGALTDRTVAAWGETGPGRPRVRIAVRPVGRGWTVLRPLPAPEIDTNRLRAATSPQYAVVTWIQVVDKLDGGGRLYLTTYRPPAPAVSAARTYTQITAGDGHTCALTRAGKVVCRGYNAYGQTRVPAGVYTAITAGEGSTCALTRAGTARCWGKFRPFREKRVPAGSVQIDEGGGVACVLNRTGKAICLSDKKGARTRVPAGLYKQVLVGDGYACTLTRAGKINCWNLYSAPTSVVQGVPPGTFTQISGHFGTACALTPGGAAVCWGDSAREFGLTAVPPGSYSQVGAGYTHACALTRAGNVVCWGRRNAAAVKEVPSGTFAQIVSGKYHACALTRSGKVVCWGSGFDPRKAF